MLLLLLLLLFNGVLYVVCFILVHGTHCFILVLIVSCYEHARTLTGSSRAFDYPREFILFYIVVSDKLREKDGQFNAENNKGRSYLFWKKMV